MKNTLLFLFFSVFLLISCKKEKVDATDTKTFQSSINDMTSSLSTLKQIKFNEALYILKTFGVEGNNDIERLKNLGKLLNGKKVPEVFSLADQVAQKNGVEWSSTAPPSLGEMNIFGNETAKEFDPNDIKASSLEIITKVISSDANGDQAIQIIPRLTDASGTPIEFTGAALATTLTVSSNGTNVLSTKNLMQDNNFKGFTLKYGSLPAQKIIDNSIDLTITVKTTNKTYKMSKLGFLVNPKALKQPTPTITEDDPTNTEVPNPSDNTNPTGVENNDNTTPPTTAAPQPPKDPKNTISKFLGNLNNKNFKAAYDESSNPNWGSYENFSNPNSGFGGVNGVSVKNVSTKSNSNNSATVNAVYDVTDKEGKTIPLNVTFGLKNINGNWKIVSYKIN